MIQSATVQIERYCMQRSCRHWNHSVYIPDSPSFTRCQGTTLNLRMAWKRLCLEREVSSRLPGLEYLCSILWTILENRQKRSTKLQIKSPGISTLRIRTLSTR